MTFSNTLCNNLRYFINQRMYSCLRFDILVYSQLQLMRSKTKSSDAEWRLLEARIDMVNNAICRMNGCVIGFIVRAVAITVWSCVDIGIARRITVLFDINVIYNILSCLYLLFLNSFIFHTDFVKYIEEVFYILVDMIAVEGLDHVWSTVAYYLEYFLLDVVLVDGFYEFIVD